MTVHRSLNSHDTAAGTLTKSQSNSILIVGLTCGLISLIASLITLRWFLLMKRTYRHHLIMGLIMCDTMKAIWYFVFPLVVFTRGAVESSSPFCQTSGFLLLTAIESADFGILWIALHAILYIIRPPTRSGDNGGLYAWRKLIICLWTAIPLILASLAFINKGHAYATVGTYCFLPRRPFWYRLALSWIPRYAIFVLILTMYTAVYVYVTLKFRSFRNLANSDSNYSSNSQSRQSSVCTDLAREDQQVLDSHMKRIAAPGSEARLAEAHPNGQSEEHRVLQPWDQVSFATAATLKDDRPIQPGITTSDFATRLHDSAQPGGITQQWKLDSFASEMQKQSEQNPATRKRYRSSETSHTMFSARASDATIDHVNGTMPRTYRPKGQTRDKMQDPLQRTRKAIRKQLRYMFIYPAVYLLMWIFPFVSHTLMYNDNYVYHPVYWLTVLTTCCLSLQAGIDCVVFSWSEKPWRRIPQSRKISLVGLRSLAHRGRRLSSAPAVAGRAGDEHQALASGQTEAQDDVGSPGGSKPTKSNPNWWEAEGARRKDSVWMGTDSMDPKPIQAHAPSSQTVIEEEADDLDTRPVSRN